MYQDAGITVTHDQDEQARITINTEPLTCTEVLELTEKLYSIARIGLAIELFLAAAGQAG